MNNKILKTSKILKNFTLEDISLILEKSEDQIATELDKLIYQGVIKKEGEKYTFIGQKIYMPEFQKDKNIKNIQVDEKLKSRIEKLSPHRQIMMYKYINVINAAQSLSGKALNIFLEKWSIEHPEFEISYNQFMNIKSKFLREGVEGLFPKHQTKEEKQEIIDIFYPLFKKHYLENRAKTLVDAKREAQLEFKSLNGKLSNKKVPGVTLFLKMLKDEYGEEKLSKLRHPERYKKLIHRKNNYLRSDISSLPKELNICKSPLRNV